MAKRVKAKQAKAKKSKARTSAASTPPVTPTYLEEGETYSAGLHDVVRALKVIEKHGHMANFVRAAKDQQVAATFDAKSVNFVKAFFVKYRMHTDPIGKHIVNARQVEPEGAAQRGRFNCHFSSLRETDS